MVGWAGPSTERPAAMRRQMQLPAAASNGSGRIPSPEQQQQAEEEEEEEEEGEEGGHGHPQQQGVEGGGVWVWVWGVWAVPRGEACLGGLVAVWGVGKLGGNRWPGWGLPRMALLLLCMPSCLA
jgi:hypothetical protein